MMAVVLNCAALSGIIYILQKRTTFHTDNSTNKACSKAAKLKRQTRLRSEDRPIALSRQEVAQAEDQTVFLLNKDEKKSAAAGKTTVEKAATTEIGPTLTKTKSKSINAKKVNATKNGVLPGMNWLLHKDCYTLISAYNRNPKIILEMVAKDVSRSAALHCNTPKSKKDDNNMMPNVGVNTTKDTTASSFTATASLQDRKKHFASDIGVALRLRLRSMAALMIQSWVRMLRDRHAYLQLFSSLNTAPINNFSPSASAARKASEAKSSRIHQNIINDVESILSSLSSWSMMSAKESQTPRFSSSISRTTVPGRMASGNTSSFKEPTKQTSTLPTLSCSCQDDSMSPEQQQQHQVHSDSFRKLQSWWKDSMTKLKVQQVSVVRQCGAAVDSTNEKSSTCCAAMDLTTITTNARKGDSPMDEKGIRHQNPAIGHGDDDGSDDDDSGDDSDDDDDTILADSTAAASFARRPRRRRENANFYSKLLNKAFEHVLKCHVMCETTTERHMAAVQTFSCKNPMSCEKAAECTEDSFEILLPSTAGGTKGASECTNVVSVCAVSVQPSKLLTQHPHTKRNTLAVTGTISDSSSENSNGDYSCSIAELYQSPRTSILSSDAGTYSYDERSVECAKETLATISSSNPPVPTTVTSSESDSGFSESSFHMCGGKFGYQ